ncbi:MAG TPA: oligosaccharide flippase family protein [Methanocella sp.]|nr:oligosaccharide flippase family protein [Methanocella sp.]
MLIVDNFFRRHLYRNSLAILLSYGSNAFFGLVFWVIAARYFPVAIVGLATVAISIGTFIVTLSKFGMDVGIMRYLPEKADRAMLYNTVLAASIVCALAVALAFVGGLGLVSPALAAVADPGFLAAFVVFVLLFSVYLIQNNTFICLRKGELSLVQNLILCLRIPLLLALISYGITGIVLSFTLAYLLTVLFGFAFLRRLGIPPQLAVDVPSLAEILKYSLGNYTANVLSIAPMYVLPFVIVTVAGAEEGAYFYIAYSVASILFMVPGAIATSLFVEGSHSRPLVDDAVRSMKLILAIMVPALVLIFLFGDRMLLLFNKDYALQSFELLKLLALSSLFSSLTYIYIAIEKVHKDIVSINVINFLVSAALIVASPLALLHFGRAGIGYAWLFTYAAAGVVAMAGNWKHLVSALRGSARA